MKFEQLTIQNFKKIKNSTYKFKPGINIIKGKNESGKSTIKTAFYAGLFESPKGAAGKKFLSWGSSLLPNVKLGFADDNTGYALLKDFQNKDVVLVDGKSGRKLDDMLSISKKMSDIMGISSQKLFEATAYIDHMMVSEISTGKVEIRDSLGRTITGTGEDTNAQEIVKKLDKKISDMEKGLERPTIKPGILRELKDSITALKIKLAEKRALIDKYNIGMKTYDDVMGQLSQKENVQNVKEKLFESNKKYFEMKESQQKFEAAYFDCEQTLKKLEEDEKERNRISSAIEEEKKNIGNPPMAAAKNIALAAGILSAVIGLVGGIMISPFIYLIILLSIPCAIYAVKISSEARAFYKRQMKYNDLLGEKKFIDAKITARCGNKTHGQIEKDYSDFRRKLKDIEDELDKPEYKVGLLSPEEFKSLEIELPRLRSEVDLLKERKIKGETYIEQAETSEEDISQFNEEIEAKEQALAENERKVRVYQLVSDMIKEAFAGTIAPSIDVINGKISEYFSILTGGKYNRVELDQNTIDIAVYSPEKKGKITVNSKDSELSRGTTDQLFLASRLALLDIADQGKGIPVFLDDPFVTFDDERLKFAMKLLKQIGSSHQIFIFTCKDTYDSWADNIVVL